MTDIRTYLNEHRPLLFDAAIHRVCLNAGCRAVKTNTFTQGGPPC